MLRSLVTATVTVGVLALAPSAGAVVFTVNSTAGTHDPLINGDCDVDPSADDDCTLRAAVEEANATAGADGIGLNKIDNAGDPDDVTFVSGQPPSVVEIVGTPPTITHPLSVSGDNCAAGFNDRAPCAQVPTGWVVDSDGEVAIEGLAFSGPTTAIDVVRVDGTSASTPDFRLLNTWFGVNTAGTKTSTTPVDRRPARGCRRRKDRGRPKHRAQPVRAPGRGNRHFRRRQHEHLQQRVRDPPGWHVRAGEGSSTNQDNIEVTGKPRTPTIRRPGR